MLRRSHYGLLAAAALIAVTPVCAGENGRGDVFGQAGYYTAYSEGVTDSHPLVGGRERDICRRPCGGFWGAELYPVRQHARSVTEADRCRRRIADICRQQCAISFLYSNCWRPRAHGGQWEWRVSRR